MRKIKDNGTTLELRFGKNPCIKCIYSPLKIHTTCHPEKPCWDVGKNKYGYWRETLPSRISSFIKRMVNK